MSVFGLLSSIFYTAVKLKSVMTCHLQASSDIIMEMVHLSSTWDKMTLI